LDEKERPCDRACEGAASKEKGGTALRS